MSVRDFLPGAFADLPEEGDDQAILGRGPNLPISERLRLRGAVGRGRANEPDDVATVETLLRQSGDLDFRANHRPTGLFSVGLAEATERFQDRNGLRRDGTVNPDGETIRALEDDLARSDDAEAREREARCVQLSVRLANLEIEIDNAQQDLEEASDVVVAHSEEADRLNNEHALDLAITLIPPAAEAAFVLRAGRGIIAALRAFVRGVDVQAIRGLQDEAEDIANDFERAVDDFEAKSQRLQDRLKERRDLMQERDNLGCL